MHQVGSSYSIISSCTVTGTSNYSNMFRITQDPSSESIYSYLIKTAVALNQTQRAHTHHRSWICRQTPTGHISSTVEPLRVVLIKYESIIPDDGPCVIRNMLEYFNVCFILEFYITQILISTTSGFECISWLINVTYKYPFQILHVIDFLTILCLFSLLSLASKKTN
jgi:hypothetical protein